MTPDDRSKIIASLVEGTCPTPFSVLGVHPDVPGAPDTIVTFLSWAQQVVAVWEEDEVSLTLIHPSGIFEGKCPDGADPRSYHFRATDKDGQTFELADPYAFAPTGSPERFAPFLAGTERSSAAME